MPAAVPRSPAPPEAGRRFGRFELRRVLGEGAQATVWLGFDQRLEREVAIKLMRADGRADPAAVGEWLREARSVSRLSHANIVPVFEADVHADQAYLVYEYVPGPTLAQLAKARGALPPHEAAVLMLGVLDALESAHAAGVVHRDLKPSNVLVSAINGSARVMDFGIAARLNEPGEGQIIVGTPGYMSPESTQGGVPTAGIDVFSVGVMLVELLSGARLVPERDPERAMHRLATENLQVPEQLSSEVDDRLRAVLARALERDPGRRWQSAAEFRGALQAWLAPAPDGAASTGEAGAKVNGTLDFLLRRMRHKSDFPALSDSVGRIQRVTDSESESLDSLSSEILKDVALTNKLLRVVNTAGFSSAGGTISTVSRAVALVGFAGVRNMAMSLVLLERMHDKAHANQLKEEFLRSLLAGMVASELGARVGDSEEAFIGAMFQNLGRLLTEFYFPEEARQVRGIVARSARAGAEPTTDAAASVSVLGLSFEALGLGVATVWDLPATLRACMRRPFGEPPGQPPREPAERLRWLTFAANEVADTLLRAEPGHAQARLAVVARRYARVVGVPAEGLETATALARQRLAQMVQAMSLQLPAQSRAWRLFADPLDAESAPAVSDQEAALETHTLQATMTRTQIQPRTALENASEVLAAGIQDITDTLVGDYKLDDVLRMIVETMYRALGLRRVVFCLRDPKNGTLSGRFGLGEGADALATSFKVQLRRDADLFTAACLKGADLLIADTSPEHIAKRLPAWYRRDINAPSFLLFPVLMKGAAIALIYADRATPGGVDLGEKELSLLRTLRNQVVMALKHSA